MVSLREEVLRHPKNALAWGSLGEWFQAADMPQESVQCYVQAQLLAPREQAWWHLAGPLQWNSQPELGIASLRHAIEVATNAAMAQVSRLTLAKGLQVLGRSTEAESELRRLIQDVPLHAEASLQLARLELARNQLTQAETLLGLALTNPYTAGSARIVLSQIRQRQGNTKEAEKWALIGASTPRGFDWPDPFLRHVQHLRDDPAQWEDRVNGLLGQGLYDEAERVLSTLTNRYPNRSTSKLLWGRLRYQQRRCPEAEQWLQSHVTETPDSVNGWVQLGLALTCQEKWIQAIPAFQTALRLKPDFAQAYHNLAVAQWRAGDRKAAAENWKQALRYNPADPNTLSLLAEALLRDHQIEEAQTYIQKALDLDPKQPRALELLQEIRSAPAPIRPRSTGP